jgi:hypothetical protein
MRTSASIIHNVKSCIRENKDDKSQCTNFNIYYYIWASCCIHIYTFTLDIIVFNATLSTSVFTQYYMFRPHWAIIRYYCYYCYSCFIVIFILFIFIVHPCMYVCMYKGWAIKLALAPRPLMIYCASPLAAAMIITVAALRIVLAHGSKPT